MEGSPPKPTEEPLFGPVPEWAIGMVAGILLALIIVLIVWIVFCMIRGRNRKKLRELEKHARVARRVTSCAPPVRFPETFTERIIVETETVTIQRPQEPVDRSQLSSRTVLSISERRRRSEPVNKSMSLSRDTANHRSKESGKSEIVGPLLKSTPVSITMNKESSTISMAGKEGSSIVLLKSQIASSSAASFTPRQGIKPVIENPTVTKSLGPTSMASITTTDELSPSRL